MAEHVGLFLPLPERLARQYPQEGKEGEDTSPPHVTLVYIGDVEDDRVEELRGVLARVVQAVPPLDLRLLPPTTFQNQKGQTILHSPVACPQLEPAHDAIKRALQRRGFNVEDYDDFKPHVTIEYVDPGERSRLDYLAPQGRWRADSVGFWVEKDQRMLPLGPQKGTGMKASVIAQLIQAGRPELANAVAGIDPDLNAQNIKYRTDNYDIWLT